MQRYILFLIIVLLTVSSAIINAQIPENRVAVDKEYRQSNIERQQDSFYYKALYQQRQANRRIRNNYSPGLYKSKGFFNTFFLRSRFGVNTMYTYKITDNTYFVGEFGYYFASRDDRFPTIQERFTGIMRDNASAMVFPLYFGIRRGFTPFNITRFYPYIGTGIGPAFGVGHERTRYSGSNFDFQYAPSVYFITGIEVYTFKKWFVDLNLRYRHMKFKHDIIDWSDFSGLSIALGFGYGFGGMQLLK